MIGRLVAVLTFGLVLVALMSLTQVVALRLNAAAGLVWWALPVAMAVAALLAVRAPTLTAAWGRLFLLDGLLWLAVIPPSLVVRASAMQEEFQPEIISNAAARYAVRHALFDDWPVIALWVGAVLIVSSIVLLRPRRSKP